jgi:hypothetical protein
MLHQLQHDLFNKTNRHILVSHDYTDSKGRKRYKYSITLPSSSLGDKIELTDYQRGCCLYLKTTLTKPLPFPKLLRRIGDDNHVIYPTVWFDSGESCARFVKGWCLTHGLTQQQVDMDYTYPTPKRMGRFPLMGRDQVVAWTGQPLDHVYHHAEDSMDPVRLLVQGDLEPWFVKQRKWTKVNRISPTRWSVTSDQDQIISVRIVADGWLLIDHVERVKAKYVLTNIIFSE